MMFGLNKKIFIGLLTGLVNGPNHTKYVSLSNKKMQGSAWPLLIYILMNTVKDFTIDVLEGVIILTAYLIKHVFQKRTEDLYLSIYRNK